ncbi:MFS transporter [Kineosporia sp. R_H_3]|uniref:MFS transporter n=1 Tax=Kineosporia sp. R_H_3 TaxID=1961848 RepID=UPI001179ABD1|nr:MFS transporter [Kineosporia sp. R_H_3]
MRLAVSPYAAVLRSPALRRLLPGLALSAVGDGMRIVALSWLALDLAPPGRGATWVAVCSASAVLPGLVVALLGSRPLGRLAAVTLGTADALLHAVALGAVPALAAAGLLDVRGLAVLLGVASLLGPWGSAARYTLLAQVLPDDDRVAGNALLSTVTELGTLVGPAVAAVLIAASGPVSAFAVDAATFVALAVAYRAARRLVPPPDGAPAQAPGERPVPTGAGAVLRLPAVTGVLALTFVFFALYGPVEVALPVHVHEELGAPVSVLSAYVVAFGVGAVLGGVTAGWLGRLPLWPLTTGIVVGWGLCLLPLGLGLPRPVSLAAFALGAFVYAPYLAVTTGLIQRLSPPALLPRVLALRSAFLGFSVPLGAVLAGPVVVAVGARPTILGAAVATVAVGLAAAVLALRVSRRRGDAASPPAARPSPA